MKNAHLIIGTIPVADLLCFSRLLAVAAKTRLSAEAETGIASPNEKTGCPTGQNAGNSRKPGKNSPSTRKIAEFRGFLAVYGLLFSDDRL
jgi:hypothetical protein